MADFFFFFRTQMYMKQTKSDILDMSFNLISFKLSILLTSGRREIAARVTSKNVYQCAFYTYPRCFFSRTARSTSVH